MRSLVTLVRNVFLVCKNLPEHLTQLWDANRSAYRASARRTLPLSSRRPPQVPMREFTFGRTRSRRLAEPVLAAHSGEPKNIGRSP